ncbi:MAG TPA: hypothetical protein VEB21_11855 [Terriglobales bacterium]|nr:hypothetical protein [Terriglobales bacterium]
MNYLTRSIVLLTAVATSAACSAVRPQRTAEVLFRGTPQELVPHSDGDEYIISLSGALPPREVYVQRIERTETPGEFVASLYRGEEVIAEFHLVDDGKSLRYTREVLFEQNVAFLYAEPLPYIYAPLDDAPRSMQTTVDVYRPSDGQPLARGTIDFSFQARRAGTGSFGEELEIRQQRRVRIGEQTISSETVMFLSPGVGEVRTKGDPIESRLVCARIAGRSIGDCPAVASFAK